MIANTSIFANQAATDAEQAAMMATSLDNLANVAIQKNNTIEKLITANQKRQKRYYAPFMGYKFIAYLCP